MFVSFSKYQNKLLTEGQYYATVVNIDEVSEDGKINLLTIKFASAEGYIIKNYDFDKNGLKELFDDFIKTNYMNSNEPKILMDHLFDKQLKYEYYFKEFDTHEDILGNVFTINVVKVNDSLIVNGIEECSLDYWMASDYSVPFIDEIEELNERMEEKEEEERWAKFHNSKSLLDDDESFGGLRGEEADTLYWNIQ